MFFKEKKHYSNEVVDNDLLITYLTLQNLWLLKIYCLNYSLLFNSN